MRLSVFSVIVTIALLLVACGGNNKKSSADYSEILGLWVLEGAQGDAKKEIMFNEDSTGFVFVADTFHCGISWLPGENSIDVKYNYNKNGIKSSVTKVLKPVVVVDTLTLQEIATGGAQAEITKYIRYKQ